MTGNAHNIKIVEVAKYPWTDMNLGDWFEARANAAPLASRQNAINEANGLSVRFASVTGQGSESVVRVK